MSSDSQVQFDSFASCERTVSQTSTQYPRILTNQHDTEDQLKFSVSGGIVCLVMRQEYLSYVAEYINQLEPMMERHEQQGLWKQEERTVVASYSFNKNGIVFVYRVLVQGNARDEVSECTLQKDN